MKKKDRIIKNILEKAGGDNQSAEGVARSLMLITKGDIAPSGQTVRRWFTEKSIPIKELCLMLEICDDQIAMSEVFVFHPWLRNIFLAIEGELSK